MFHSIPIANWFAQLAQGDSEARQEAIEGVHELEPPILAAVPTLARLLTQDPDEWVRIAAADVLGTIEPVVPLAISALVAALKDRECLVREAAAHSLSEIGPATEEEVLALVEAARDRSVDTAAFIALGESGPAGTAAIPFLVEALADPEQAEKAADALGSLGSVANPAAVPLIAALKAENVDTRRAAADALGRISPPARPAVRALRAAIDDQEFYRRALKAAEDYMETVPTPLRCMGIGHPGYVRHAAARALWRLGRHDLAIPVLVELLRVSAGYLRRLAVITLGQVGPLARRELNRVIASSHDPDAGVRSAAIEALARIGGAGQVPAIISALDDDDQTVRIRAAERLGLIGRDARVATGRLKRMAAEGAPFDRLAASATLWHICRWPHTAATIVESLHSTDVDLRLAAVHTFADLPSAPKRAIAALESALSDDNQFVRRDAAAALAEMKRGE